MCVFYTDISKFWMQETKLDVEKMCIEIVNIPTYVGHKICDLNYTPKKRIKRQKDNPKAKRAKGAEQDEEEEAFEEEVEAIAEAGDAIVEEGVAEDEGATDKSTEEMNNA